MDGKTLIFKFHRPATPKLLLLVESGVRVHATEYDRGSEGAGSKQPSHFCARLRHWLRERRCTGMGQWGFDRIVWLAFGHDRDPTQAMTLVIELYSAGNVILLDHEQRVLLLMRTVKAEEHFLAAGSLYAWPPAQPLSQLTLPPSYDEDGEESMKKPSKAALKAALPSLPPFLIDELIKRGPPLAEALRGLVRWVEREMSGGAIACDEAGEYRDYGPPLQESPGLRFATLNQAVDAFYWHLEQQRLQVKLQQQGKEAERKQQAIEREQQGRLAGLQAAVLHSQRAARLIEGHLREVEGACAVVRVGLEHDLSWEQLERLVADERAKGRPMALLIKKLKLAKGAIELDLDEQDSELSAVEVLVQLGGHANAQRHWEAARLAQAKLERTEAAYQQAMASAAARIKLDLAADQRRNQLRQANQQKRRPFWFERFNWFISSDDYLVLSGRDAQQNELLVKRHLRAGDAYVHADMAGAASVIIKNRRKRQDEAERVALPPRTLAEAGNMALVCSRAWEAKIVTSAWWVWGEQVSKTAPSGEYLGTGSFMIRGRKNFLPPSQLTFGFGILFALAPEAREQRRRLREEREQVLGLDALALVNEQEENNGVHDKYLSLIETRHQEEADVLVGEHGAKKPKQAKKNAPEPVIEQEKPEKSKGQAVRGKKGKAKKIAKKYADQDEEEREARMALLASAGKGAKKAGQKPKVEQVKGVQAKGVQVKEDEFKGVQAKKDQAKGDEDKGSEHPLKGERMEQEVTGQEGDGDDEVGEDKVGEDEMAVIDALTGSPTVDELAHLLHALPVCFPITALQRSLLRVKLAPGTIKRGKAAQQAWHLLQAELKAGDQNAELRARLLQLVRAMNENELTQTMIGRVRLVTGQQALEKAIKQTKSKK